MQNFLGKVPESFVLKWIWVLHQFLYYYSVSSEPHRQNRVPVVNEIPPILTQRPNKYQIAALQHHNLNLSLPPPKKQPSSLTG